MPAYDLRLAQAEAQYGLSSSTQAQDPREGLSLAGRTTQGLLRGGLIRQAREEAERSRRGVPREELMTQAMTIKTRQAPGGRQPAQCPRFLFGAKGASAGAEYRGIRQRFPYRCNETKTSRAAGWRSSWSPRQRHHQCLWQAKTTFVRISYTSCPLSNWPLPSRSIFGRRTRASINRTSHRRS